MVYENLRRRACVDRVVSFFVAHLAREKVNVIAVACGALESKQPFQWLTFVCCVDEKESRDGHHLVISVDSKSKSSSITLVSGKDRGCSVKEGTHEFVLYVSPVQLSLCVLAHNLSSRCFRRSTGRGSSEESNEEVLAII